MFPNFRGRPRTWAQSMIVERRRGGEVITSDDLLSGIRKVLNDVFNPPEPPPVRVLGANAEAA